MEDSKIIPGLVAQKDGSFAIFIETGRGACLDENALESLWRAARETGCRVHLTTAQKIMLLDLDEERGLRAMDILRDANLFVKTARDLSQPRVCVGKPYCRYGFQQTFDLSDFLMERLARKPVARKLKVGIAGCPACCSWANCLDVGFVGVKSGFWVYIGGHGGARPRAGEKVVKITSFEEAVRLVDRVAKVFTENVRIKSRLDRVINRMGREAFLDAVGLIRE
ncbi:MAG TPA: hypothetical protein EYP57_03305 [Thermodesulfobacteriaceae bacterium]|nr:hypothetical protein [Thermodesulfobacteriaceae bacterium]